MNLAYTCGRHRRVAGYLWFAYMTWVAFFWLGLAGVGLACVAGTRWLRALCCCAQRRLEIDVAACDRAWVMPWVVWVRAGGQSVWLFRDEMGPAQWAALLRSLRLQAPQAVGLSMSR